MQISDYLYAIRRRLWVVVAVPLAAALVTAGVIYLQPERYQATATVVVPALSAKGYSTSAVTQYVSTYKDVLISAPVVNQVSLETGEPKADLVAGLSAATATASSNIIVVTFSGKNKKNVTAVAEAAAIDSMDILLTPQLAQAQTSVVTSKSALDTANQNLTDFTTRTGLLFPDEDYKTKSQELSQLIVQLTEAKLAGDKARIAGLQTIVDARQKELVALAPLVAQYQTLVQARAASEAVYNRSEQDINTVNAEMASDHDPRTVTIKNIGHISRLADVTKFGGVALGVALLLSIAFIIFTEFFAAEVARVPYLRRFVTPVNVSKPGVVVPAAGGAAAASREVAAVGASAPSNGAPRTPRPGAPRNTRS